MSEMLPFIRNYFSPSAVKSRRTNGVNPTVTPRLTASDGKRRRLDQFSCPAGYCCYCCCCSESVLEDFPLKGLTMGEKGRDVGVLLLRRLIYSRG